MIGLDQDLQDFYTYPSVGPEDWRYVYQTAEVRAMEMQLLSKTALLDVANAPDYQQAVGMLGSGEYAALATARDLAQVERILLDRRAHTLDMFAQWMLDCRIVGLFRSRIDLANLRIALKRMVTKRPIGTDYADGGNVPAEQFARAFEQEQFELLPDYLREPIEQALIGYYQTKDIRQIDLTVDRFQAAYELRQARRIGLVFLVNLFRIRIDLDNLRTMVRLRLAKTDLPNVFLDGGFLDLERLNHGLGGPVEALPALFYYTPYSRVVEEAVRYFAAERSFLKLEQACDEHMLGFLRSTVHIASGPQPIIAYLLVKEHQIRMVRLVLTAKRHHLDVKLIQDRLAA